MNDINARTVEPCAAVRGQLCVGGDKSISHRLAMLGGLADGAMRIDGFLEAEDCLHTLGAMQALGAAVEWQNGILVIDGCAGRPSAPREMLDLGNSGTAMRLLSGLLAGQPFESNLTGDASLCSRPMERIRTPLELMGARVELLGAGGCAPLRVQGGGLKGIHYELPVASAQVKSCLLLAGLGAEGMLEIVEPRATRDHTELLLQALGVELLVEGTLIRMHGGQQLIPPSDIETWHVPGDFSSAAFWLVAAACRLGSDVRINGLGLNRRRTALLDVLQRMGAEVMVEEMAAPKWESTGSVTVRGHTLSGTVVAGDEVPNLIDELPLVAVAAAMAEGETVVRDAAELRVKESDRIAAITACLRSFGVEVHERQDGFCVVGKGGLPEMGEVTVDSMGDHRIAMCGAVMGLFAQTPTRIENVACVETSYPGFWSDLGGLRA